MKAIHANTLKYVGHKIPERLHVKFEFKNEVANGYETEKTKEPRTGIRLMRSDNRG